jgi:death-on-curing protein
MIELDEVLIIHEKLISIYGGSFGVRDLNLLESSINRAFNTFAGKELYPTAIEKASAILESIVKNHPFVDGNKRTGYFLCRAILLDSHFDINATENEKFEFVIKVAKNEKSYLEIKDWLENRVQNL